MEKQSPVQLIVGLCNPEAKYASTRHNAGAWFVDRIAEANHATWSQDKKCQSLTTSVTVHQRKILLSKPTTYMNASGRSLSLFLQFYKLKPDAVLVIHDDIDLAPGDIRLKIDGGHGGHNGLRDIIKATQSKHFKRLRIGVGHPGQPNLVHDYVLKPPSRTELQQIEQAIDKGLFEIERIIDGDISTAMLALHSKET